MTDKDGIVGTSCDCRHTTGMNCIHNMLIERYHTEFEEPVLEGEEPAAFLLYSNYKGLLYLFSAATASGLARHHSHKRTIVTCDLDGNWRCKSCSRALYSHYMETILMFRNCHHIDASKENLKSLPGFSDGSLSIPEAADVITRSRKAAIIRRCVSHLPIPPPAWCRLLTDTIPITKPLQSFPDIFLLDDSSRCACGNANYKAENPAMTSLYIVYTSTTALQLAIATVYCYECSNTRGRIGPDLSNYGILNWNNKMGFSHQLLNQYTSHFTHSETPFNAFYRTILDEYLSNGSPVNFCDDDIFEYAWLAFVRLQKIQSNMQCSLCGPHPKVVIADGISVSFPTHHQTEALRPPTTYDKSHAWVRLRKTATKSTSFIGPGKIRSSIYNALNTQEREKRLQKLGPEIEKLKIISVSIILYYQHLQTIGRRQVRRLHTIH
jgi:CxC4 like cysteine cluster associated with KDZ transposases